MNDARTPRLGHHGSRGRFIVIVGPDGVGKTSLARALIATYGGPSRYFHFRPLVLRPMLAAPPETMNPAITKCPNAGSKLLGWVRIARNWVRIWAGYFIRIKPAVSSGQLVVGDRWAYGYLVQPAALGFFGPAWLAKLMLQLLPNPDLVINLTAPVEVIRYRKQELTMAEISVELSTWRSIPAPKLSTYDTQAPTEQVARKILQELDLPLK